MTRSCTRIRRAACLWACVGLALGTDLWAQPADRTPQVVGFATSFEQLRVLVGPGAKVTVTDAGDTQLSGRIVELSSSSLSIIANGTRRDFGEGDIASIRQRRGDPLGNGALWGAAISAGLVVLTLSVTAADCDCDVSAGAWLWLVAGNAAFGAGLGVGIDALIRRDHVIYRQSPRPAISRRLTITPALGRRSAGVSLSMGF